MKKLICLLVALMLLLAGCAKEEKEVALYVNDASTSEPMERPQETKSSEEVPVAEPSMAQSPYYESLEVLTEHSTSILIGMVQSVSCKRISETRTQTRAEVTVKEVMKGSIIPGQTVTVVQTGGAADGYDMAL